MFLFRLAESFKNNAFNTGLMETKKKPKAHLLNVLESAVPQHTVLYEFSNIQMQRKHGGFALGNTGIFVRGQG